MDELMKNDTTQHSPLNTTPATAGKAERLSPEDEARSFEAFALAWEKNDKKNYNKHFERIFASYQPLAASIVRKYAKAGIYADDIAAEADYALCKAIKDYRDDKGTKFSTFATMRITYAILEAFNGPFRLISVPRNRTKILDKARTAKEKFTATHNRPPTREELLAIAGISENELKSGEEIDYKYTSLNMQIGDGEDACEFGDFIEDKQTPSPSAQLDCAPVIDMIYAAVTELPYRERSIVLQHTFPHAQGDDSVATYEEVGRKLKTSKVTARNLERRALTLLRSNRKLRDLAREYGIVA